MLEVFNKIKRWYKHRQLVKKGVLIPIESYEQYTMLIKNIKKNYPHKIFSNCYMLPSEIKRLIALKSFYKIRTAQGLVLADDEGGYYHTVFFVDLSENCSLPVLDKDILVENVYYEGRKTSEQINFESLLENMGFTFCNTYRSIMDRPSLPPEKFYKKLAVMEKALAMEGKKISIPKYSQLYEFEKVYRSIIDKFVQKKFTLKERKAQADAGNLYCITDETEKIYAIAIKSRISGGAYGSRRDSQGNIYAPILVLYLFKEFYDNIPKDETAKIEYMRSKGIGGWIAVNNISSWKVYRMVGIEATEKSMNQFVIKSTM
ncbi:MAG: hypothetical protein Q4E64_09350 [Phascolarctobacterium sp.]|uniref:hypothetical protein n=1 Tax=Phascolarctobacterium sp. TaxID=2049039 RepID=UPI0026DC26D1|nr:hypothetical protein [Phascolarctobacterium sp.]MDO4922013.1 hypothetical protein [Phascolarctobacterium sp.]